MDLRLQIHSELLLEAKQEGELMHCDLIPPPVDHPYKLLTIIIKVEVGVELVDNLIVLIILETHHLGHLQSIKSCFDLIEVGVAPG
jgi:hypothetical protein